MEYFNLLQELLLLLVVGLGVLGDSGPYYTHRAHTSYRGGYSTYGGGYSGHGGRYSGYGGGHNHYGGGYGGYGGGYGGVTASGQSYGRRYIG